MSCPLVTLVDSMKTNIAKTKLIKVEVRDNPEMLGDLGNDPYMRTRIVVSGTQIMIRESGLPDCH